MQFREEEDANGVAFGGYVYGEYLTGWPRLTPRSITLGGIYLSGDNLNTTDYEGWDPMFGRWPKWSESYIYSLISESGVAHWTNLISIYGKTAVIITDELGFNFDYHRLMAPRKPDPLAIFPGGKGNVRGDLFIGRLSYKIKVNVSGHFHWESFLPGDYYFRGADHYGWARMELMLRF